MFQPAAASGAGISVSPLSSVNLFLFSLFPFVKLLFKTSVV